MITKVSHATIYVLDQDAALDFYINKLGFEARMDQTMDKSFRWLTVGPKTQPDLNLILMRVDGPNMKPEVAEALKGVLMQGKMSAGVLAVDDCQKTYEELVAKGVEFLQPPAEKFYGVEALMKDNSGNWFSMTQRKIS